jgi:hypothetical protein
MIVRNRRDNITYFCCSARINRDGCNNGRNVPSVEIEARVLAALQKHLLEPDVIATAIEAYRVERQRLSREAAKIRASLERELGEIRRKIKWLVGEIENGRGSPSVSDRLYEVETRQEAVKSQLALAAGSDIVELHPQAAERYAAKVADIHAALARGDDAGQEAIALVRELVTRVRVNPGPPGEPVGLEIAGDLAAILSVNETGPACMVSMVAGVGFEPTAPPLTLSATDRRELSGFTCDLLKRLCQLFVDASYVQHEGRAGQPNARYAVATALS